jgi:hypothetical protein
MKPAGAFIVGILILYLVWTGKAVRTWRAITS